MTFTMIPGAIIMLCLVAAAIMPPDHNSDFDDHLRRGVHELCSLEEDVVISVFVCYSRKNVPSLAEDGKVVNPVTILEDLRAASYKVSVCTMILFMSQWEFFQWEIWVT